MHKKGFILIDAILALALAGFFIVIITDSSFSARTLFDSARERNSLLNDYEANVAGFSGLLPMESLTLGSTTASSRYFGNDRVEIDMAVSSNDAVATSTSPFRQSLEFERSDSRFAANFFGSAGTPLCAVDFSVSGADIVGSYSYMHKSIDTGGVVALDASITPIFLPIDPSIPLTDLQVRHGTAYISTDSAKSSDPDIIVADIRDPDNAVIYSQLSTGPGIASIVLAGSRVFAAETSRVSQLQVIRIPSLNSPILESFYKLPLPYATATPSLASAIFYDLNRIYLGTEKWDGEELAVIDVSNPAQPVKVGGFEIGSKVNDIFVKNGIAYVADSDEKQMRVIDVRDPANPREISAFSSSGWERQEGRTISMFEGGLSLGRTSGGFNIATDHELFSWATSSSADWTSEPLMNSPAPDSVDIPGGVYGIVRDRSYLYLATRQTDKELQIFKHDLSTTTIASFSLPVAPQTLTCDNDKLYLLAATAPVIYEISFAARK